MRERNLKWMGDFSRIERWGQLWGIRYHHPTLNFSLKEDKLLALDTCYGMVHTSKSAESTIFIHQTEQNIKPHQKNKWLFLSSWTRCSCEERWEPLCIGREEVPPLLASMACKQEPHHHGLVLQLLTASADVPLYQLCSTGSGWCNIPL